ncbi:DUF805 domain-containing protein [Ferirhizobium litorale]
MRYYIDVWARSFQLAGRLGRKGYWVAFLWHMGAVAVLTILDFALGLFPVSPSFPLGLLAILYLVAATPANWTSTARRLHDANFRGWWVLLCLIPYIGTPIVIVLCCLKSSPGGTRFDREEFTAGPQYAVLKNGRLEQC